MKKEKILGKINKMKNILEKHIKIILVIAFIIGTVVYGYLVSKLTTNITFLKVDEELYISMARTFFYDGVFAKEYQILDYSCVIYSILISIAYFFYSAKNILFFIRFIGVVLMMSSMFPVYLLSNKILNSKIKALGLSILNIFILEMGLSAYAIQEVLLYPVFLWTIYLIYRKFSNANCKVQDFAIILLIVLLFFIKSYAIAFAGAYFLTLLIISDSNKIKNVFLQGLICLILIGLGYFIIYAINGFQVGINHYSSQIKSIFPITIDTLKALGYGIWYYAVFFLFCTGILPIIAPILNLKKYEKQDKKFLIFLILSAVIAIVEVAIIVFIPEEKGKVYPNKFCYRYLFVLQMPFLIMLMKLDAKKIKINKIMLLIYDIIFIYLIWYYIGQGTITPIIDAPILYCIQQNEVYNGIWMIVAFFIISNVMLVLVKTKQIYNIKLFYIGITLVCLLIYVPQYWKSTNYLLNYDCRGEMLKTDFTSMSETIGREYDEVYLISSGESIVPFVKTIVGQLQCDYKTLAINEVVDIKDKKVCVILPKGFEERVVRSKQS